MNVCVCVCVPAKVYAHPDQVEVFPELLNKVK